jgi:hypothetical protein
MYQRARKLHDLINDPSTLVTLAEEQLEAYLVAMNALSLLDRKSAWVSMPASLRTGHEVGHCLLVRNPCLLGYSLGSGGNYLSIFLKPDSPMAPMTQKWWIWRTCNMNMLSFLPG